MVNIALANLGKISVNLNYSTSPDVVHYCMEKPGAVTVITAKKFTSRMPWPEKAGIRVIYLEDILPRVSTWKKTITFLAARTFPKFLFFHCFLKPHYPAPHDTLTLIYSSGSTGKPKAIMLTHENIAANAWSTVRGADVDDQDCLLGALPFFHSFGYTVSFWTPLQVGASTVYYPDPRQAREIGTLCKAHSCTIYLSTATFLRFCLKKAAVDDFKSLRILICGAEKLPVSLAKEFEAKFDCLPLEGYGCTELSPVVSLNQVDIPIPGGKIFRNQFGAIGMPIPGVAVQVVDPVSKIPLETGQEGMVLATGLNVMKGYFADEAKTQETMVGNWYTTGDIGKLNPEGFITLTGRLSRFAKIAGEMVPLERVEEELHALLKTSERVCGVTCVPDLFRGERIVVLYLPKSLESFNFTLSGWTTGLKGKGLPNLWIPSDKDFHPVEEIASLGSGKLDLAGLKAAALKLAGNP